jgi:plasmid stabilization system protein ParE
MMREVRMSSVVLDKFEDIVSYLKNDFKFSDHAIEKYRRRFGDFLKSLENPGDYARCRNRKWYDLGYRCVHFQGWVLAYEIVPEGIIIHEMTHAKLIHDVVD